MESILLQQKLKRVFNLLKYTFVIIPIVAGADKFTNFLTNWEQYMNSSITEMLPVSGSVFMMLIGLVEIIAGIIVYIKSEIGGYIVASWLTLVALSLLIGFNFIDIAVRDLVMAIAAFSMAKISKLVA
ncbi:MAG: hypothetical protein IT267_10330 [Saprospiraceae bacterium]|nr:hypothetical protein [Saprospiraceae bacterium]